MYLFLSFVVALISLYYLGVMVDTYNADTTYLTPLVALLIYSVLSIVRELKKDSSSWFAYDDDYHPTYRNTGANTYNQQTHNQWNNSYTPRVNEKTEYFTPTKREKKEDDKLIVHYPSSKEVREKVKELEKSRWFRFKKAVGNFFGHDITQKYYDEFKKPYKINRKGKVVTISNENENKEDHSRFTPNKNWWAEKENEEYNAVTKLMCGRSCEISLTDEQAAILLVEETNNSENNEQK